MRSSLLLAVLAAAAATLCAAQAPTQNTYDGMVARLPSCATKYATLENTYYSSDPTCKVAVKTAMQAYVNAKATCPDTSFNSQVWKCMNGWNGTAPSAARVNDWITFVKGCEIFYIGNRLGSAETESGFSYKDNSCFGRFNDVSNFADYLNTGAAQRFGSAGRLAASLATIAAGVVLVLGLLYQ